MKYAPNEVALTFLNRCKKFVEEQGFEFKWKVAK